MIPNLTLPEMMLHLAWMPPQSECDTKSHALKTNTQVNYCPDPHPKTRGDECSNRSHHANTGNKHMLTDKVVDRNDIVGDYPQDTNMEGEPFFTQR